MRLKLIILTLFFTSVSHCSLPTKAIEEGMTEGSLPEFIPSDEDWLRALNREKGISKTEGDNLMSIFRSNFFTIPRHDHLITRHHPLIDTSNWSLTQRSDACDKWIRNRDQVISVDRDTTELSDIITRFSADCPQTKSSKWDIPSPARIERMSEEGQSLELIETRLKILKEFRLLGLAGIDQQKLNVKLLATLASARPENSNTPAALAVSKKPKHPAVFLEKANDLAEFIAKKAWITYVNSIVSILKRLIDRRQPLLHLSEENHLTITAQGKEWLNFTLKTIDFLFKNKLTDHDTVRQFFQSREFIEAIACYTEACFSQAGLWRITLWSSMTKHWYWHRLHECFKALSRKEEAMIDAAVILISRRHDALTFNRRCQSTYSATYESILGTFQSSEPLLFLGLMYDDHSSQNLQWQMSKVQTLAQNQALKIMNFFGDNAAGDLEESINEELSRGHLERYLCYILEFIENYISPGITNNVEPEIHNFQNFAYRFHQLKFNLRCDCLAWRQVTLFRYMEIDCQRWSSSTDYKDQFNKLLLEATEIFHEFQKGTSRLFPESAHEARTLEIYQETLKTGLNIRNLMEQLEKTYMRFQPRRS